MPTYTPLQSIQLTEATSSVTFSGIPQTYQDLLIVANVTQTTSNNSLRFRFNGDTGSNYSSTYLFGNGTSAISGRESNISSGYAVYTSSNTSFEMMAQFHVLNYSNSTTYKTTLGRGSRASEMTDATVSLWRSTAAITSVSLAAGATFPTNNFTAGSTFDLYGISPVAANNAQAFGGTDIYYDSSYVYHVFKGSGTFTPYRNLTCDYLVVAGGGGGGRRWDSSEPGGGGGGAGGYRTSIGGSALSLTANTNYTVTVGAGGSGGNAGNPGNGYKGSDSVFSTITSTGGGYGGGYLNAGGTGGSAGGHGRDVTSAVTAGNQGGYSPVEGFAGGRCTNGGNGTGCGGGGGAGGAGNNGTTSVAGTGGIGAFNVITNALAIGQLSGGNYYVAGGGGGTYASGSGLGTGAAGGVGGGGNGATNYNGTAGNGTSNTGGGGGGGGGDAGTTYVGGSGGSGIVIVRYAR